MRGLIAPALAGLTLLPSVALAAAPAPGFRIPVAVKKLANGMTIVVSEDHSAPTFGMSTAFHIGFRLEPKGRTGFAHLFEHMMFEGTPVAPKGTLTRVIEGGGGVLNGSTRNDYTNYIASAPVSALDAILWLEADRMKHLDFSEKNLKNQQEVVKEEIRVNVKNRPYGLFFWTDLVAKAFDKWENNHDGYGSFEDLDAANLKDVETFFNNYYGPNNAVLGIVGDVTPEDVFAKAEKYFGALPSRPCPRRLNFRRTEHGRADARAEGPAGPCARGGRGLQAPGRDRQRLRGSRGAGRRAAERRGVAALPGAREGQGADAAGPGRRELPLRESLAQQRPDPSELLRALQAGDRRQGGGCGGAGGDRQAAPPGDSRRRTSPASRPRCASDFYSDIELPINRADALALAQLLLGDANALNEIPGGSTR